MWSRGHELKTLDPKLRGASGVCLIPDGLVYLDWNKLWVVPFYHAFYYGVVKRLFEFIYPCPGGKAPVEYFQQPGGLTRSAEDPLMLNFPPEMRPARWVINLFKERSGNIVSLGKAWCWTG